MASSAIQRFKGLNNVSDPLRLGLGWLARADNVVVTDTGGLNRRPGYSLSLAGSFTSAYSTRNYQHMYVVDSGVLKAMAGAATAVTLVTGISDSPMYWTEINERVYYNNGVQRGVILPDNTVLPWGWDEPPVPSVAAVTGSLAPGLYQVRCAYILPDGRKTGTSDVAEITLAAGQALRITDIPQSAGFTELFIAAPGSTSFLSAGVPRGVATVWNSPPELLGREPANIFLSPLPSGADIIEAWRGRVYASVYMAQDNQSAVMFSQPLGFHLFDLNKDFLMVPGKALMLVDAGDALVIGTEYTLYAYDGKSLKVLADYGVVPGWHVARDDDKIMFWTTRGLCEALPLKNLTERQVSVAPGVQAGGTIVRSGGQKRYVVALHSGGLPFNPYV